MNKKLIKPNAKEDAEITKAAKTDPDSKPLSKNQWKRVKPTIIFRGNKKYVLIGE